VATGVVATGGHNQVKHKEENPMESNLGDLHWFKSSFSAAGNCVEVAHLPGGDVAVRDSKDRAKTAHVYTRSEWEAFLAGAKNGEFDLPLA
jgi:Domain of unknown function (DUF397)